MLVFGKPNHSGEWRVRMSLLKYYYSNVNILFQSCYDSKVLVRTSVIKAKLLISGSSEQGDALTVA